MMGEVIRRRMEGVTGACENTWEHLMKPSLTHSFPSPLTSSSFPLTSPLLIFPHFLFAVFSLISPLLITLSPFSLTHLPSFLSTLTSFSHSFLPSSISLTPLSPHLFLALLIPDHSPHLPSLISPHSSHSLHISS